VNLAGQSHRVMAAALIAAVHAIGLYALTTTGPEPKRVGTSTPIIARLIISPQSEPKWQPPAIKPVHAVITASMPEMPFIEIPMPAASSTAISIPASNALRLAVDDRGAPKLVSTVEYLREPSPRYPPQSRRLREQGLVILRVLIDEHGTACQIEIENSSGYARLDHAAREAVQRAAFRPYVEDGAPRRALVLIPIEFSLNRGAV
jgi:protein TonB